MSTGKLCNRDVVIVRRDSSVQEAAQLMRTHHVGDLVVVEERDGERVPVGIITDRDIVVEVIAKNVELGAVSIGDVMSFELVTVNEDDDIFDTVKLMRTKGVRRVPVVDKHGVLVGILTVDDLVDALGELMADVTGVILREQKREQRTRP
ncbi:MAG: CBS domain-containing protein [Acidiferrobacterales bacterium]